MHLRFEIDDNEMFRVKTNDTEEIKWNVESGDYHSNEKVHFIREMIFE